VVDRGHGLREKPGVAEGDAEHKTADAYARRFGRGRGQRDDGFETVTAAALVRRFLEVIRDREPVETTLVGEVPQPSQLVERPAEVADVDAEPDVARLIPVRIHRHAAGRRGHE
jgi:hypothetical protein